MAKSIPHLLHVWGFGGDLEKSLIESTFKKAFETLGLRWKVQFWDQNRESIVQGGKLADKLIILAPKDQYAIYCREAAPFGSKAEVWDLESGVSLPQILPNLVNQWIANLLSGETQKTISPEKLMAQPLKPSVGNESKPSLPTVKKISLGREIKGRAGKGVTTLFDIPLNTEQIKELATTLKQKCGTGGTVKDGCIEIQGDQRERIIKELEKLGFQVKRVGG